MDDTTEWVSASELAAYTYCGRAYWLERVVHAQVTAPHELRRTAGVDAHNAHGRRVSIARLLRRLAVVAALLVVLALLRVLALSAGR
jgi:hypothetical protein